MRRRRCSRLRATPALPCPSWAVNNIVKDAAERAGVNPAASVHRLRPAHASHAIDNGAPITLVSATLGHADVNTTSVYACAARRKFGAVSQDKVTLMALCVVFAPGPHEVEG